MSTSSQGDNRLHLGEMLVAAGIISLENLQQALLLGKLTSAPVGKILLMTDGLKERDLESALQCQDMIRNGEFSYEFGMRALQYAVKDSITLDESLRKQGWVNKATVALSELAELLLFSGAVAEDNIVKAATMSERSGKPLGRTLIEMNLASPTVIATALNALALLKQRQITREAAIHGVRFAVVKRLSLEQALSMEGRYAPKGAQKVKLGELFGIAGIITEMDKLSCVEEGLAHNEMVGQIFLKAGLVNDELLSAGLYLQNMIKRGLVTVDEAAEILRSAHTMNIPVTEAISRVERFGSQVINLLKMAGIVKDDDVKRAMAVNSRPSLDTAQALYDAGIIAGETLTNARECLKLVRMEKLKASQAVILLDYCVKTNTTVYVALQEMAWDKAGKPVSVAQAQQVA